MSVKIGFILNSYTYGGAERRIKMLVENLRSPFEFVGLAAWEDMPIPEHYKLEIPMWIGESFAEGVEKIAQTADLVITSCRDIGHHLPQKYKAKIIGLSQCGGDHPVIKKTGEDLSMITRYCVANSEDSAKTFTKAARKSNFFKIIHNGFDPETVKPKRSKSEMKSIWRFPQNQKVIGFIGRLAEDKGVDRIAKAVKHLPSDWSVVYYGKNSNFESWENKFCEICEEEIPGRYRIYEWTEDIGSVLNAIDVFCLPSMYEGFSNSLAEAWMAGVPTVSTKGVGASMEFENVGVEVDPKATPNELAEAIKEASGFWNSRVSTYSAQKAISKFSIQKAVEKWREYLLKVHEDPIKPKVMLMSPNLSIGGAKQWLVSILKHSDLDFRCVFMSGESHRVDPTVVKTIENYGCNIHVCERNETKDRLVKLIPQIRPNCIMAWGVHKLHDYLSKAREKYDGPIIVASHGNGDSEWTQNLLKDAVKVATHFTAVSKSAVDPYPKEFQDKVKIINNGIEWPNQNLLTDEAKKECRKRIGAIPTDITVGFIGRLSLEKNPYILACAMNELPRSWKAWFIGPAYYGMDRQVQTISKHCRYLPPFPLGEIYKWLPAFDVLCVPSIHESFCLVTAEAWACGVPVCMTDVGISKEVEEDVMVRVPNTCDPKTLALGIVRAYYESPFRVNLARKIAKERFSAKVMAEQWSDYIKDVCKPQKEMRISSQS